MDIPSYSFPESVYAIADLDVPHDQAWGAGSTVQAGS